MTTRSPARTRDVSAPGSPGALMPDPVRDEIARLGDLDLDALRLRWRKLFRASAPPHLTRSLLLRIIALLAPRRRVGDRRLFRPLLAAGEPLPLGARLRPAPRPASPRSGDRPRPAPRSA